METNNLTTRSRCHSQSGHLPREDISPNSVGRRSHLGTEAAVEGCVLVLASLLIAWLLASNLALRRAVDAKQRVPFKRRDPRERTFAAQRWWWMVDLSLRCFWSVLSPFKRTLHHSRYVCMYISDTTGRRHVDVHAIGGFVGAVFYPVALSFEPRRPLQLFKT